VAVNTPIQNDAEAARRIADWFRKSPQGAAFNPNAVPLDVVTWGEKNFYIPSEGIGARPKLIRFLPHQKIIMHLFFNEQVARKLANTNNFQTLVFSTVKKSGKTALAALVARWITETWGSHAEVYSLANDLEQARGRIYQAALTSIELDPRYQRSAKGIPDLWRIIERQASFLPTNSSLRAVSSDYKGEAGSNPVATLWSELWGYSSEAAQRLWEELTPVPTRPRSIRYVETYAGYENESGILNDLEDRIKKEGRRLEHDELASLLEGTDLEWPWPNQKLPFWVHVSTRTFAYWDSGVEARRMPWQVPEYYVAQAGDLREPAFNRLHLNVRASNVDDFIPLEWWDRLVMDDTQRPSLKHVHSAPMILGADASVSADCTALTGVQRNPKSPADVMQVLFDAWQPTKGHPLDYSATLEPRIRLICTGHIHPRHEKCETFAKRLELGECPARGDEARARKIKYNVVELAYDQYQLHDLMTRLRNEGVVWCRPFSQHGDRMIADKALFDMIRDQRIHHMGDPTLREHINGAGAKVPPDDNTKLRIVKKGKQAKIDGVVALSMAAHECTRLMLS
jgi:hypothetical protein